MVVLTVRQVFTSIRWKSLVLWRLGSALIVLVWITIGHSQDAPFVLTSSDPVSKEIARGQTQSFTVELREKQFAQVVFEWEGLNLNVGVLDPHGQKFLPADVAVTSPGPVSVWILAEGEGVFKFDVTAAVRQKISGKYRVSLRDVRSSSPGDSSYLTAQTLVAEGSGSSNNTTKIDKFNQANKLWQNLGAWNDEARTFMLLGDAYRNANNLDRATRLAKASDSFNQAAAIWKREQYVLGQGYAELSLASANQNLGSSTDALKHAQDAQKLFAQISDRRGEASALYSQTFAQMSIGQTSQVIETVRAAASMRHAIGDRIGEANALNILADANRLMGNLELALSFYGQATEALRGLEHTSLEAALLNGTALVYDDWGYWQQAKESYVEAIGLFESLLGADGLKACLTPQASIVGVCRSLATTIDNLGEIYNSLGEPDRALVEFARAVSIRDALAQPIGQGQTRYHIGYSHYLRGDSAQALKYYNEALPYQQIADDQKGIAVTYTYMGMALTASNKPKEALDLYRKALPYLEKSEDKRAQAITYDKLGSVQVLLKDPASAEDAFNKALALWRSVKDADGEALTLYNLAVAMRNAGDLKKADEYIVNAIRLVEGLRTQVTNERLRASYLANKTNYYELDVDLKMQLSRTQKGNDYVASALEANEKARARVLLEALNEAGVERSVTTESSDPRFSSMIEQRLKLLSTMAAKAQARTRFLSGLHSAAQIANFDRELRELSDKYDDLESKIRTENPKFAKLIKPEPATLRQIQEQLDDDTCFIEYSLGEPRSYAWVVTRNSIDGVELGARSEIEAYANRLKEALSARGRDEKNETRPQKVDRVLKAESDYAEASSLLSRTVLAPVADKLTKKRLLIVADGALQLLPFTALPDPNAVATTTTPTRLMIQSHELISLPSASVLVLQRKDLANRKPAPNLVAVIADPVFGKNDIRAIDARRGKKSGSLSQAPADLPQKNGATRKTSSISESSRLTRALEDLGMNSTGEIRRLPYAGREASAILKVAPPNQSFSAIGFKANRAALMNPRLAQYRIIHLATHGIMDLKNPELSGMLLSMLDEKGKEQNGYIGLSEIYNLKLPADLVVLSACETGTGKEIRGEGIIALTRGFMYAGAERLVASLWRVDDQATAELMAIFYDEMLVHKLKPAAALREAQRKLSQQPKWKNPHFWASFVIQGEWR
jgi:CHAT domain-containing protein